MSLVADVFKALLISADGEVIAQDELSQADIGIETETNDVIAGRNELIAILHGRREITIDFQTPRFNFKALAQHVGTDVITGEGEAYAMPKWYKVGEDDTISLDNTPLGEKDMVVEDSDGKVIAHERILITGKEVAFSSGVEEGDSVRVVTYKYKTPQTTQTIEIDSGKFPKDVKLVLETLEIDDDEQTMSLLQFEYPRVKPSANFSISTASAREAVTHEMSFRVLKPKEHSKIGAFKRIPVTDTP
ncbi:hypothetical protein [Alkalihalobacillus sp. 1P02AB]|uniref:hypothetical protein n=1 Tax=Alkalihalobacillus sp. 1P02AB TaxID=3132260 RepID=UPI0039A6B5C5